MMFSILCAIIGIMVFLKMFSVMTKGYCVSNACLNGKTAVITGGNSGLGYQCALNLASRGCRIIIADVVNAERSAETIKKETGNPNVVYRHIDLASFASVRKFAASLRSEEERLDILINNAGCGGLRTKSDDGIYKVLQINYLGHFLLTHLLAPLLIAAKNSRVVFVSSISVFVHNLKKGQTINRLSQITPSQVNGILDYANSKLAMLAASDVFAERLAKHGVLVSATHPGVSRTEIWANAQINNAKTDILTRLVFKCVHLIVRLFGKTQVECIQSILHCALSSGVRPGDHIVDCGRFRKPSALDDSFRKDIWEESLKLASVAKDEEAC